LQSSTLIIKYFKKHWLRYVLGIVLVVVATIFTTEIPKYLGFAIDALNEKQIDISKVQNIAFVLGAIAVLAFVVRFVWRYLILGFGRQIEFYMREELFAHLQSLSSDFYVKNNTGDIITRSIVDIQAVRMMLGFSVISMLDIIVTTSLSVSNMAAATSPLLTLLAILPIPLLIFIILKVRVMVRKRYNKVQEAISNISSKVQENITGIRVIKAFSQEVMEAETFSKLSEKKVEAEIKLARAFSLISPSVQLTFGIVFSAFLVFGGSMVAKGEISLGSYVAFNTYLMLIMGPITMIGRIVDRWQRGLISMKRVDKILLEKPSIDDTNADASITVLNSGEIKAKNLSFSYENTVLSDVYFDVPSGGSIAIMGPTGSGKSTIASLLMRVWNCENGMLEVDGHDINKIPLKVLREACAYVPQESFLFSDSILENIRFYDSEITDSQVFAAAEAANVHDNILEFPLGYATVVGERGMTLSGGQKQRIALARALVRNPKILILDDCMSALDIETEAKIIENLKTKISTCTAVIITHRATTAALADTVLYLGDEGEAGDVDEG